METYHFPPPVILLRSPSNRAGTMNDPSKSSHNVMISASLAMVAKSRADTCILARKCRQTPVSPDRHPATNSARDVA